MSALTGILATEVRKIEETAAMSREISLALVTLTKMQGSKKLST